MNEITNYLNHNKNEQFNTLLFSYIDKSGEKDSEVYKRANVSRKLFSKIRCSEKYIPNKKTIIKLCLSLKLDKSNVDKLLKSAGYALSSSEFDLVISYFVENSVYDLDLINNYLYTHLKAVL